MAMTFRVTLPNIGTYTGSRQPYDPVNSASLANEFPTTRVTWFPNKYLQNRELKNGDTFEVSGKDAIYLKNNFTSGPFAFLEYVSGTAL